MTKLILLKILAILINYAFLKIINYDSQRITRAINISMNNNINLYINIKYQNVYDKNINYYFHKNMTF
jgi:hypothetical protein